MTTFWNLGLGRRSPPAVRLEALALLARSRVLTSHDPGYLAVLRRTVGRFRPTAWLPVGNNLAGKAPVGTEAELRSELGLPPAEWLGYFGQLDPTRGVEGLFVALALARRNRDIRLVMIGSAGRPGRYDDEPESAAYLRRALALPERHGVADAVVWTDYLPDETVLRYLCAVDLCVLPYRQQPRAQRPRGRPRARQADRARRDAGGHRALASGPGRRSRSTRLAGPARGHTRAPPRGSGRARAAG